MPALNPQPLRPALRCLRPDWRHPSPTTAVVDFGKGSLSTTSRVCLFPAVSASSRSACSSLLGARSFGPPVRCILRDFSDEGSGRWLTGSVPLTLGSKACPPCSRRCSKCVRRNSGVLPERPCHLRQPLELGAGQASPGATSRLPQPSSAELCVAPGRVSRFPRVLSSSELSSSAL